MRGAVLGDGSFLAQTGAQYIVGAAVYDGNSRPYKKIPVRAIFQQTGAVLDPVRETNEDGVVHYSFVVPANIVLEPVAPEGFASTPTNVTIKAKLANEFKQGVDEPKFYIGKAQPKFPWVPIAIGAGVFLVGYFYYRGR